MQGSVPISRQHARLAEVTAPVSNQLDLWTSNRPPERPGRPTRQSQPSFAFPLPSGASMTETEVHHRNFQRDDTMMGRARRHPGETGGLAGSRAEKTVSLALQGGGAHGAFTWGVLGGLAGGRDRRGAQPA